MEAQEDIDMQIWDYLDGNCDELERERISSLIECDSMWTERFRELCALHRDIPASIEQEEPSVRFTKNVMDVIAGTQIARPARKYLNHYLIKGIAAGMVLTICAMLVYILVQTKWVPGNNNISLPFSLSQLKQYDTSIVNTIVIVNILLALVLLDSLLRKRRKSPIHPGQ